MKKTIFASMMISLPLLLNTACGVEEQNSTESAATTGAIVRSAAGADSNSILDAVKAYRKDLGGENNLNAPGTQAVGHREINWDGVPAAISSPNYFPGATFKNRGLLISSPGVKMQVSTKNAEAAQAPTLFGNLRSAFPKIFNVFSAEKLFTPVNSTVTNLTFTVPGSDTPATVTGFGAVFTDVDVAKLSKIEYYSTEGKLLHEEWVKNVPHKNKSLSFVGVSFKNGKKIAKVKIISGNVLVGKHETESQWKDAVVMDDFLYAEPKAIPTQQW